MTETAGAPLEEIIAGLARTEGFDTVGITRADAIPQAGARLKDWVAGGAHGDMGWMAETLERRADPAVLWPAMRSVIMLGLNYGPADDPRAVLAQRSAGAISVYARAEDYHDIIKPKLKRVARALLAEAQRRGLDGDVKVFVDTAPLMEKPLAAAAGLGWQGRHTNLVSRDFGSWLFLGAIATTLELRPSAPEQDHCGSCRACLDACPTAAFPAPYVIDARRCVSYLTIEHKGPIPRELRPLMGNRIYGCDDCLAACPWNKFAELGREVKLAARAENDAPPLAELVALDDAAFRARFPKSPIKRVGRDRFVRNVLVAMGNSGDAALLPQVEARLGDASALVRGAAVWALGQLADPDTVFRRAREALPQEDDAVVRAEWAAASVEQP
ncbi:tRNA epoxyqueuosine(34) reductase QueG [Xanthobacter sp. DSM 14520]|uniref:tRNA epoxyqueuosine(34) reductase QueG n=1 Tax=Xanthobacter autotrophicus (strain ATCC BAA-1158 / Py2) TaxID=78245 RepID=UPI00372999DE